MGFGPNQMFPGATTPDPLFPRDKFKDNAPATTNNGTPLKAIKFNQDLSCETAMMEDAKESYTGTADAPDNSQIYQVMKKTLGSNENLLLNHNFSKHSPDGSEPLPDATPRNYPAGYEVFKGWFANDSVGVANLTYIAGQVNFTAGDLYQNVPNTETLIHISEFTASVKSVNGNINNTGINFSLISGNYKVVIDSTVVDVFSVKFEEGIYATSHSVLADEPVRSSDLVVPPLNNFYNLFLRPGMVKTGATVAFPPEAGGATIASGEIFAYGWSASGGSMTNVTITETGGMNWNGADVKITIPTDSSDLRTASDIVVSFYDENDTQHYLTDKTTRVGQNWEIDISPSDLTNVGATRMRRLHIATEKGEQEFLSANDVRNIINNPGLVGNYVGILPPGVYTSGTFTYPDGRSEDDYSSIHVMSGTDALTGRASSLLTSGLVSEGWESSRPYDTTGAWAQISRVSASSFSVERAGSGVITQVIGYLK